MSGTSGIYYFWLPDRLCSSPPLLGFYWNRWGENSFASGLNAYNLQITLIQYDSIYTKIWARSWKNSCLQTHFFVRFLTSQLLFVEFHPTISDLGRLINTFFNQKVHTQYLVMHRVYGFRLLHVVYEKINYHRT